MEPSTTTNSTTSHENQHKSSHPTISTNDQLPSDEHHHQQQPLIISCKEKNSPNMIPSTCVVVENVGDVQEIRGLENEPNGRERLMRHWREVSGCGGIAIPERWGHEELLKEWIDCSTFDALLAPKEACLAREALVAEAQGRQRGRGMSKLSV